MRRLVSTVICSVVVVWIATVAVAEKADRGSIADFLEITGFDVALESIRLSAGTAPGGR